MRSFGTIMGAEGMVLGCRYQRNGLLAELYIKINANNLRKRVRRMCKIKLIWLFAFLLRRVYCRGSLLYSCGKECLNIWIRSRNELFWLVLLSFHNLPSCALKCMRRSVY